MKTISKAASLFFIYLIAFSCNFTNKENRIIYAKESDSLIPRVVLENNFVMPGEQIKAKIFLQKYMSNIITEITVDGYNLDVSDGMAEYRIIAKDEGKNFIKGNITITNTQGDKLTYPFIKPYTCFNPNTTIDNPKTNFLFAGTENLVYVSSGGIDDSALLAESLDIKLNSIGKGLYKTKPSNELIGKTVNITLKWKTGYGIKMLGVKTFRVLGLPEPKVFLGNKDGGKITKVQLSILNKLSLRQEDFLNDDIHYNVNKYTISIIHNNKLRKNYSETVLLDELPLKNLKDEYSNLSKGDMIIISDIDAKGPVGPLHINSGPVFTIE